MSDAAAQIVPPAEPEKRAQFVAAELQRIESEGAAAAAAAAPDPSGSPASSAVPPPSAGTPAAGKPRNPVHDADDTAAFSDAISMGLLLALLRDDETQEEVDQWITDAEKAAELDGRRMGERLGEWMGRWLPIAAFIGSKFSVVAKRVVRKRVSLAREQDRR